MMTLSDRLEKIFHTYIPPNSKLEIFFRTQYHHLAAHPLVTSYQIKKSKASYKRWVECQKIPIYKVKSNNDLTPIISIIMPIDTRMLQSAKKTISSLDEQSHHNWEVVFLVKDDEPDDTLLNEFLSSKSNFRVTRKPNFDLKEGIRNSSGEYITCVTPGSFFLSNFLSIINKHIEDSPGSDLYYFNSCEPKSVNGDIVSYMKPMTCSPELLLSQNYLANAVIKKEVAEQAAEFISPGLDFEYQEQELCFLLSERKVIEQHIPQLLLEKSDPLVVDNQQRFKAIQLHMQRLGFVNPRVEVNGRVLFDYLPPKVSLIILSRNNHEVLEKLLDTLLRLTVYPDYEILIVDNKSNDPETLNFYKTTESSKSARIIHFDEEFNYSKAENLGAKNASGDVLLFLNDDMEVLHSDWLSELTQWIMYPQIGIVGAKLLFPNRRIQHSGIVLGMNGFMGHLYLNAPEHYSGLLGSADWYRNVSAVTGACQMMRKEVFETLGGYNENYKLVFSDIDLCLRAIERGYRVLVAPFVPIIHLQGHSRGYDSPIEDIARAYDELEPWLINDDPYFSSNLTYSVIPKCHCQQSEKALRVKRINQRKRTVKASFEKEGQRNKNQIRT